MEKLSSLNVKFLVLFNSDEATLIGWSEFVSNHLVEYFVFAYVAVRLLIMIAGGEDVVIQGGK